MRNKIMMTLILALTLGLVACGGGGETFVDDGSPATMTSRINGDRTASGLDALSTNTILSTVAQAQAAYMASSGQLSSTNGAGVDLLQQVQDAGITAATSRLISTSFTEQGAFDRILADPASRSVISGVNSTAVGVGYATGGGLQYWCILTSELVP